MATQKSFGGGYPSYIAGFALSIALTLCAYELVVLHTEGSLLLPSYCLVAAIVLLALLQLFAQAFFFLHIGHGPFARWKIITLSFMVLFVFILVAGSLWIMYNLAYRMTPQSPAQMEQYMTDQGSF